MSRDAEVVVVIGAMVDAVLFGAALVGAAWRLANQLLQILRSFTAAY